MEDENRREKVRQKNKTLTVAEFFQLLLQCYGGVVCPKNLCSQSWHEGTQVFI